MQNIKIEIDGVQRNLEPMENQKKDNCSLFFIEGKWYREVERKDYEILSFRRLDMGFIQSLENGLYVTKSGDSSLTLLQMLDLVKVRYAVIHSVKRLSDVEVFTVGEDKEKSIGVIEEIKIEGNFMMLYTKRHGINIKFAEKVKQPAVLLTTYDGVKVTNPNQLLFICHKNFNRGTGWAYFISTNPHNVYFSTEEARDEYILYNKPVSVSIEELTNRIIFNLLK